METWNLVKCNCLKVVKSDLKDKGLWKSGFVPSIKNQKSGADIGRLVPTGQSKCFWPCMSSGLHHNLSALLWSHETTADNVKMSWCNCISIKLDLQNQAVNQIGFSSHNLPTPIWRNKDFIHFEVFFVSVILQNKILVSRRKQGLKAQIYFSIWGLKIKN